MRPIRPLLTFALLLSAMVCAGAISGCALIDEDATLDPTVMEPLGSGRDPVTGMPRRNGAQFPY